MEAAGRQRIDKWLWFARVVKTRSLAQDLAQSGHVRLNGERVTASSHIVRNGDVLTIGLESRVRVLKVRGFAERRGAAPVAQTLYEDLSPPAPARDRLAPVAVVGVRDAGAGRPTKRERRQTDRLLDDD
jgi:ribosome-associated heat shock protein Hsp15